MVEPSELDEFPGLWTKARLHRCRSLVVGHELNLPLAIEWRE
jgi:hypothetical protein